LQRQFQSVRRRKSRSIHTRGQTVAAAGFGLEVARMIGVMLDLLAQSPDGGVELANLTVVPFPVGLLKNILNELTSGAELIASPEQVLQQFVALTAQRHAYAVYPDGVRVLIDTNPLPSLIARAQVSILPD